MEVIYYDSVEPTFILYQCFDLLYAANFLLIEVANIPQFWTDIILYLQNWLGKLHYSSMLVAAKNPTTLSAEAYSKVETFIRNFPDTGADYTSVDILAELAARLIGWDGNYGYSSADVPAMD
jgi:hypothetical protein